MASYTQAQLDALRTAAAKGVRKVEYDGQRVEYGSVDDMLKLISVIERDLSGNTTTRRVFGTSNGFR